MRYLGDSLKQEQQIPTPELETSEKIGETFEFLLFFFSWAYFTYEYDRLPSEVPISFDLDGQPEEYGSKTFLFAFPAIHTIIYMLLTALGRYPQAIKYPIIETPQNKETLFIYGRKLILYFKIISSFMFIYLTFGMINVVRGEYGPQDMYNCFAFILLYIPAIVFFFKKCRQLDKKFENRPKNNPISTHLEQEIIIEEKNNRLQQ